MSIAFDASFLILAFDEKVAASHSSPRLDERMMLFRTEIQKTKTKVLIPTPALSEFLVRADAGILEYLNNSAFFKIVPFDERAAIEAADMTKAAIRESDKKDPVVAATWAKIKFDRQIVAVAKVEGAHAIYSTDPDVCRHAQRAGIICKGIDDLPKAPDVQQGLFEHPQIPEVIPNVAAEQTSLIPPPPEVLRSGDGHPQDQAGAEAAQGKIVSEEKGE